MRNHGHKAVCGNYARDLISCMDYNICQINENVHVNIELIRDYAF